MATLNLHSTILLILLTLSLSHLATACNLTTISETPQSVRVSYDETSRTNQITFDMPLNSISGSFTLEIAFENCMKNVTCNASEDVREVGVRVWGCNSPDSGVLLPTVLDLSLIEWQTCSDSGDNLLMLTVGPSENCSSAQALLNNTLTLEEIDRCHFNNPRCAGYCQHQSLYRIAGEEEEGGDNDDEKEGMSDGKKKREVRDLKSKHVLAGSKDRSSSEGRRRKREAENDSSDDEDIQFDDLSNTEKMKDFCECLNTSDLDCGDPGNNEQCTDICTGDYSGRPFCNQFQPGYCSGVCSNVSLCNGQTFGDSAGMALCMDQCCSLEMSGLCWLDVRESCSGVIDDYLDAICSNSSTISVNDTVTQLRQFVSCLTTEDLLSTLFGAQSILFEKCEQSAFEFIDILRVFLHGLLDAILDEERVTMGDFEVDIKEGFTLQENILFGIEILSDIISNRAIEMESNSTIRLEGENYYLQLETLNEENFIDQQNYLLRVEDSGSFNGTELIVPLDTVLDVDTSRLVVTVLLTRNLANLLDAIANDSEAESIGGLVTVSIFELQDDGELKELRNFSNGPPITLFLPVPDEVNTKSECVLWNTILRDWSTDGISTITEGERVRCGISHFTSFSVLVSPAEIDLSPEQEKALSIVTYIGCSVSVLCLILTVFGLIAFRKVLNKGPLLYVHLNLALSLLIALVLFIATVEHARKNEVVCTVTTAFLHYFLLCSFCWMLCEGIMLYLMVVRVFGRSAEKWYRLLIIGYGLPVPIVTISAGVLEGAPIAANQSYTSPNYCWLNADPGAAAIWTFIAPMALIVLVNSVILIMTVISMVRGRKRAGADLILKKTDLAKTAIKASFILLPLMGITWVIGVFAVNRNTVVFAWLFTILNSLQGAFIFFLHVLKNDNLRKKLFGKVDPFRRCRFRSSSTISVDTAKSTSMTSAGSMEDMLKSSNGRRVQNNGFRNPEIGPRLSNSSI